MGPGALIPVAVGNSVAADSTIGVLSPASFTGADGATSTISSVVWELSSSDGGRVKVDVTTVSALAEVLGGHVLDFIELDGMVSLSLDTFDATVVSEPPGATEDPWIHSFRWDVSVQPWSNGDELMVRIREAPLSPTPASTLTPTPTPTPPPTDVPVPTQTPAPSGSPTSMALPDLVVGIEARLQSNPDIVWGEDGCIGSSSAALSPHVVEATVHVRNVGNGDAGSFTVQLNNDATEIVDVLEAGVYTTLVFTTWAISEHVVVVDADFSIEESDESNNIVETFIPVPTIVPPPTCTPSG